MNCWWKMDDDWLAIYTEDLKSAKTFELKPMATYEKNGKIFAYQFKVEKFSKNYKKIYKILDLTDKDQHKNGGNRCEKHRKGDLIDL